MNPVQIALCEAVEDCEIELARLERSVELHKEELARRSVEVQEQLSKRNTLLHAAGGAGVYEEWRNAT